MEIKESAPLVGDQYVDIAFVARMLGVSKVTVRRYESAGILPKRIAFSKRCKKWNIGDLRAAMPKAAAA